MQSEGQERNTYRCSMCWSVQHEIKAKCPSFCFKDFYTIYVNGSFKLVRLQFNSSVRSLSQSEHATWQAAQKLELWSEIKVFGLLCAVLKCIQYGYEVKTYRTRHHGTDTLSFRHTFIGRLRRFSSEWSWHWWWYRGHYWHRLHTGYWQYTLSTCCL